jgi:uncharacterized protein (TIGR03083 family)
MTPRAPVIDVRTIHRIAHDEAMAITAVENQRFARQLRRLTIEDWTRPTDCTRWNVKDVAAHVVGSAAGQASPREFARQVLRGRPLRREIGAEFWWDGMNEIHVRERAHLTPDQLVASWDINSRRALQARTRLPRAVASLPLLGLPEPVGRQPLGYLFDVGFTRDVWAHRIDISVATGTTFEQSADHDGRIVADLVAEWAATHGEPFTLELTGPAGGTFSSDNGAEHVSIDVIEFARTLSGRRAGTGVMRHPLPL